MHRLLNRYMTEENNTLKVESSKSLVRDKISKAIINTDDSAQQLYFERKKAILTKDQRIDNLEKRLIMLEAQIEILKKMVQNK